MGRITVRATALLLAGAGLLSLAGPASPAAAKGVTPAPTAPAPAHLDCFGEFGDPTIPDMTAPDVAVNYAGEAGCVGVRVTGTLRLAWVVLAPGWSYVVKSNGTGSNSRVQLQFTQGSTGKRIDFRFELGRTSIG
ncbi:MAG: hypothetical protein JWM47_3498 [Acidimicrobiales bacterium]|nr:hypothetical protein [Acidimicrobiales bacterium]